MDIDDMPLTDNDKTMIKHESSEEDLLEEMLSSPTTDNELVETRFEPRSVVPMTLTKIDPKPVSTTKAVPVSKNNAGQFVTTSTQQSVASTSPPTGGGGVKRTFTVAQAQQMGLISSSKLKELVSQATAQKQAKLSAPQSPDTKPTTTISPATKVATQKVIIQTSSGEQKQVSLTPNLIKLAQSEQIKARKGVKYVRVMGSNATSSLIASAPRSAQQTVTSKAAPPHKSTPNPNLKFSFVPGSSRQTTVGLAIGSNVGSKDPMKSNVQVQTFSVAQPSTLTSKSAVVLREGISPKDSNNLENEEERIPATFKDMDIDSYQHEELADDVVNQQKRKSENSQNPTRKTPRNIQKRTYTTPPTPLEMMSSNSSEENTVTNCMKYSKIITLDKTVGPENVFVNILDETEGPKTSKGLGNNVTADCRIDADFEEQDPNISSSSDKYDEESLSTDARIMKIQLQCNSTIDSFKLEMSQLNRNAALAKRQILRDIAFKNIQLRDIFDQHSDEIAKFKAMIREVKGEKDKQILDIMLKEQ